MSYKNQYPAAYERGQQIGRESIQEFPPEELSGHIAQNFATLQDIQTSLAAKTYVDEEQRTLMEKQAALYEGIMSRYD